MGLLDNNGSMGNQMDPQMMQQLLSMLQQQNTNPFIRPLPGDVYLPGQAENPFTGGAPGQYQPQGQLPQGLANQVAESQHLPGLPNFPKQMGGFGMGSMTPKIFNDKATQPQNPMDLSGGNPFAGSSPSNLAVGQLAGAGGNQMSNQNLLQSFLRQSLGQGGNIGQTGQF